MGLEDREPKTQFAESAVSRFFAFKRSLGALTLFGVFLVLLAQPHNVFPGYLNQIAQVQSGLALSALFIYLYGVVVATWRSVKIDYVAAFQFKLSSALIETQVWNVAAVLSVVLGTSVGINLAIHDKKLWPDSLPVFIAYFFFVGVLTVPVKLFYRPTRMYLLLTLVQCFLPCCVGVQLIQNFVADVLTSACLLLWQLEYGLCFFLSGNFTATTNPLFQNCGVGTTHHLVAQPIMYALPFWLRLQQCVVRFWAARHLTGWAKWQHAVNAGKYVSCVLLVGASTLDTDEDLRHPFRWTKFRYIWLAAVIVKTSYCYVWDILFDWGLGSPQYGFLRKVRFFQDKRVYYFAIFTNLLGRISWSFAISPHQCPPDWIVTLSTIEIFRRAQWAVYRVENFVIESGSTPDLEKPFLHTTAESPTSAAETPTTDATHGSSGFLLPRLSTDESDLERRAT